MDGPIQDIWNRATGFFRDEPTPEGPNILVTGFTGWSQSGSTNITEEVISNLRADLEAAGHDIQIFDVNYHDVDDYLNETDLSQYDYVISLGQNIWPTAPAVRFEERADDLVYIADDDGNCPLPDSAITKTGLEICLPGRAPVIRHGSEEMLSIAGEDDFRSFNIAMSTEPGDYLCEYLYHSVLQQIEGTSTQSIFIHLGGDDTAIHEQFMRQFIGRLEHGAPAPAAQHDQQFTITDAFER